MRKITLVTISALGGLLAAGMPAQAGVQSNTTLASPNGTSASSGELPNGSFYNGNGNPQGNFEVNTDNGIGGTGIELGLAAVLAFVGPVMPPPVGNTYTVPTGVGSNGRATWDYEFSIDLTPNGVNGLTFATALPTALLTILDVTTGQTGSFNPLLIPDDSAYKVADGLTKNHTTGVTLADTGAQNSESLSFVPGFNPWVGDTYQITLSIAGVSDSITVNAVPEPASLALLAAGFAGIGAVRRRRRA